jgi:tripartite motif-containing protein 71
VSLISPIGITQQRTTGRYFISELNNHRIQVLDENFTHQMFIGEEGSEPGQLNGPWGVAVSEEGRLVVCDSDNKRLQVFDVNSDDEARFISMVKFDSNPQSVVMEEGTGRLFVSLSSNQIGIVSMDGQLVSSFGSQGSNAGQLNYPMGVALNSRGDLFVGDSNNKRVSVFDKTGDYLCHFGSDANFDGDWGLELAIDSFDRIVVSDSKSNKLSMFDGGFKLIGQYGSKGSEIGQFNQSKRNVF